MAALTRRIGVAGATGIGLSAMLGAGVFAVWRPATASAGELLLLGLAIAGVIAALNALTTTRLAIAHPTAGGLYRSGTAELGELPGFAAGVLFLVGKTASAALIAGIAARYALPDGALVAVLPVTVGVIAILATVNATGIRSTAAVAGTIAAITATVLVVTIVLALTAPDQPPPVPDDTAATPLGVLAAANAIFFAFAGYARMATLAEEVRRPRRTLVPAVLIAVVAAGLLYAAVGIALVAELGPARITAEPAPVAALVGEGWAPVVRVAAVLACLGSLIGVLAGLSRTGFAMARDGRLPRALATLHPRTGTPVVAETVIAALAIVAALRLPPDLLVGVSSCAVLGYYAIGHAASIRRGGAGWRVIAVTGLLGCAVVAVSAPWPAVLLVVAVVGAALVALAVSRRVGRA